MCTGRDRLDPESRPWDDLAELQAASDIAVEHSARRRRCPATGSSIWEAWQDERRHLAPLPILPQPFDHVATRPVGDDALVHLEGRQYSVPFPHVGRRVELRGAAGVVQILADVSIIAEQSAAHGAPPGDRPGPPRRTEHADRPRPHAAGPPRSAAAGTRRDGGRAAPDRPLRRHGGGRPITLWTYVQKNWTYVQIFWRYIQRDATITNPENVRRQDGPQFLAPALPPQRRGDRMPLSLQVTGVGTIQCTRSVLRLHQ